MEQLSRLIVAAIIIVLSASRALAAGPGDPFAKADAMVAMCSGLLALAFVLTVVVGLVLRARNKRNKNSSPKTAETTDGDNDGNTAGIIAASDAAPGSPDDTGPQSQAISEPRKKTVTGFARAWIIFWIVGNLAAALAPINRLSDTSLGGIAAMVMLLSAVVAAGHILLYYRNPIGLYLVLAANLLGISLNNIRVPNYSITVTTGLVIGIITYFVTRKQVAYPFGRSPATGRTTGAAFRAPAVAESPSLIRDPQPDNGWTPEDTGVQQSAILTLGRPDDPNATPSPLPAEPPPSGGAALPTYPHPPYTPLAETSRLAIASLVTGIGAWLILPLVGAVIAVVTGHLARKQIRRDPERVTGTGLATAGLVLGYAQLGVVLLIAIIAGIMTIAAQPRSMEARLTETQPIVAAATEQVADIAARSPAVAQARQGGAGADQDSEYSQTAAPRTGRWEGEPSVSLYVASDGQVRNLEITVPFGMSTCAVKLDELAIGQHHEITWGEPIGESLGSTFKSTLFITGRFTGETALAGTYRIGICHRRGDTYTVIDPPAEGVWNAEWKTPSNPPTTAPIATATPQPSPTETLAPTPTPGAISLAEALAQKLAEFQMLGTGAASGNSVLLVAVTSGGPSSTVKVEPGLVLRSAAPGEQDMVVRRLLGWRVDEQSYNPADLIYLTGIAGSQTYAVEAYCLNFHKDNPSSGTSFTLGGAAAPAVTAILDAVDRVPGTSADITAIQAAIWAVTDDPGWPELAERGYEPDHERVRALLQEAGLDPACTALFGGACQGTPQASEQGSQAATISPSAWTASLAQVKELAHSEEEMGQDLAWAPDSCA